MLLKEIIARGNTAEVYATDDKTRVVKLFFEWSSRETVEHEYHNAKIVTAADFDKPNVYEMLEINGRFGIVYERIPAATLLQYALDNGYSTEKIGAEMARLHAKMLSCRVDGELETDKQSYARFISYSNHLTESEKSRLYAKLEAMPCGSSLCHGDYHPQNITTDGKTSVIIDFMNVYKGNPASDIARTFYLVKLGPVPEATENKELLIKMKTEIGNSYAENMERAGYSGWRDWLPIITAARSGDGIPSDEQQFAARLFREMI